MFSSDPPEEYVVSVLLFFMTLYPVDKYWGSIALCRSFRQIPTDWGSSLYFRPLRNCFRRSRNTIGQCPSFRSCNKYCNSILSFKSWQSNLMYHSHCFSISAQVVMHSCPTRWNVRSIFNWERIFKYLRN